MRNYLSEMLYALTSAYSRKDYNNRQMGLPLETSIGKLFSIFAWGLDSVQEQTELVRLWDNIDNARGSVLDRYGANFGVKRISSDDRYYRLAIKVKVMAQLSGGDIDTVIWAAASLLEVEPSDVLLEEVFPAKIALYVDQDLLSKERQEMIFVLADAIKRILAAGVGMRLYLRTYRTFRYSVPVNYASAVGVSLRHPLVGENRLSRMKLSVGYAGVLQPAFSSGTIGRDMEFERPLALVHSLHLTPVVAGVPPDTKKAASRHQNGAGGAYARTYIKAKRID